MDIVTLWHTRGNQAADAAAKEGADLHPEADPDVNSQALLVLQKAAGISHVMSTLLPLWPPADRDQVAAAPRARPDRRASGRHAHSWA